MTMKELAKQCHVSVSTVSKAFSEAEDISEETKKHIFETAKSLGCFGKFYKGKYHKKIIGVICPEVLGGFYAIFLKKLQDLIEASGAICMISADNFSARKQAELIEYYAAYLKADGCIVIGLQAPLKKGYDIPIVSLFSQVADCDCIDTDMNYAMTEAVSALYDLGHRHIVFLGEALTRSKAVCFQNAIKAKKDCFATVLESSLRFEQAGADCICRLIDSDATFTAVICAYDNIAIGAIKQLQKAGYRIPNDVSVVGINNIGTSSFTETSLTTIDITPDDICSILWGLMENKLSNKHFRVRQNIVVKPRLILRESIGNAKEISDTRK